MIDSCGRSHRSHSTGPKSASSLVAVDSKALRTGRGAFTCVSSASDSRGLVGRVQIDHVCAMWGDVNSEAYREVSSLRNHEIEIETLVFGAISVPDLEIN